jgi:type III secretory pathway component EscS
MDRKQVTLIARILFWCAALVTFVMAVIPQPPHLPGNPSDKLQHLAAFLVLALLASRAYPSAPALVVGLCLGLFGAAIELVQAIPQLHRDPDALDLVIDVVAISAVFFAVTWLARRSAHLVENSDGP